MLKNRKLYKEFINNIKNDMLFKEEVDKTLKTMPLKVIKKIGYKVIDVTFDGYTSKEKQEELKYFDDLNRIEKEFFIKQRLHCLCC